MRKFLETLSPNWRSALTAVLFQDGFLISTDSSEGHGADSTHRAAQAGQETTTRRSRIGMSTALFDHEELKVAQCSGRVGRTSCTIADFCCSVSSVLTSAMVALRKYFRNNVEALLKNLLAQSGG